MQHRPHAETSRQAMGSTTKTAVKERGVPVKSAAHPIRKTAGIGKPGGEPPVKAFLVRQTRCAAAAETRLARTQKAAKVARVTDRQAAQAANHALRAVNSAAKTLAAAATAGGGVVIAVWLSPACAASSSPHRWVALFLGLMKQPEPSLPPRRWHRSTVNWERSFPAYRWRVDIKQYALRTKLFIEFSRFS